MIKEDAPLVIKLDHKGPIALDDFSGALDRLAKRYARLQRPHGKEESSELFISRIREGSVELSLVGTALAAQASIEAAGGLNNVIEFGRNLASLFQYFKEKSEPSSEITISDCDDVRAIMKPIITTNGGGLIISVAGDGNIIKIDQQDAREIDNRAALERSKISTPTEDFANEVLFVWDQIRDAPAIAAGKHSPDRGIIAAIDKRAHPVTFADPDAKNEMYLTHDNPFELAFVVDVKVLIGPRGIAGYRITKLHDTIPIDPKAVA